MSNIVVTYSGPLIGVTSAPQVVVNVQPGVVGGSGSYPLQFGEGYMRFGAAGTTQTFTPYDSIGSNVPGADLIVGPGKSTGTGTPGAFKIQVGGNLGFPGSAVQERVDAMTFTNGGAYSEFPLTFPGVTIGASAISDGAWARDEATGGLAVAIDSVWTAVGASDALRYGASQTLDSTQLLQLSANGGFVSYLVAQTLDGDAKNQGRVNLDVPSNATLAAETTARTEQFNALDTYVTTLESNVQASLSFFADELLAETTARTELDASLAPVAKSGAYGDLTGRPSAEIITLDFGSGYSDKAQVVLTGRSWVSNSSVITAQVMTPAGMDPDEMHLYAFRVEVSNRVEGVGFTVSLYTETEYTGAIGVAIIGI